MMVGSWNKQVFSSRPDCIFHDMLKNVKEALKVWSKEKFGDLERELSQKKGGSFKKRTDC